MSLASKLFTIEWIKIRKRAVFWVAAVGHAVILLIALGGRQYVHYKNPRTGAFQLPNDWAQLISNGSQIGMLLLIIGITQLLSTETAWRTQRQNVIDGLSRAQYFGAKVMVVALLSVILWLDTILIGLIVAPFGGAGALTWPVFSPLAQQMIPNMLLYLAGMGSVAFLFGMLASTSGAALGLVFVVILIEPIIGGIMTSQGGLLPGIARFLPLDVVGNLVSTASYDAQRMAQINASMVKAGMPERLSLQTSMLVTVIYIGVFIGMTWLAFRKRDL